MSVLPEVKVWLPKSGGLGQTWTSLPSLGLDGITDVYLSVLVAMEVDEFGPTEYQSLTRFRLSGWSDVEELFEFRESFLSENPGRKMLFVLDDRAQAGYTSGHGCDKYDLTPWPGRDELGLTLAEQAAWEELGFAPEVQYSAFVVDAIRSKLPNELELDRPIHLELSDREFFECLKDEARVFETPLLAATVYADEPSMAIAAYPNGYFSDDLSPMQNYLLAEILRVEFGLEIFGLGSFLAAYVRDSSFGRAEAERLVDRVRGLLYEIGDDAAALWVEATVGQRWFVLSYCGGS